MLSGTKAAKRARQLLKEAKVRTRFSPALAIAYELRTAKTCAARLKLLPRTEALGDGRSIAVLAQLSTGSRRGCGKWKRRPCAARCAKEAEHFRTTVKKITRRLKATGQR